MIETIQIVGPRKRIPSAASGLLYSLTAIQLHPNHIINIQHSPMLPTMIMAHRNTLAALAYCPVAKRSPIIFDIIATQEKKDIGWDLLTKVLSQQFLVLVLKELSPQRTGSIQDYFQLKMYDKNTIAQTITSYFQENYMKKISVEEIKTFGTYSFEVKLYQGITAQLFVSVGE